MLTVESLACRRGARLVFRDTAFSLKGGDVLLVTGANGTGKSSLLRILAGLLEPAAGTISWQGQSIATDADAYRQHLHYVGHLDAVKPELTAGEMLDYWRLLRGSHKINADDPFGITALNDKPSRYLSAGQRRRLSLTRLVMDDAPLWLLDEPTTALDAEGQKILNNVITRHREQNGIAIIAMHHGVDLPDVRQFAMQGQA